MAHAAKVAKAAFVDVEVTVAEVGEVTLDEAGVVLARIRNIDRREEVGLQVGQPLGRPRYVHGQRGDEPSNPT